MQELIRTESASGVILIAAALLAFAWANSPLAPRYFAILEVEVGVGAGGWGLEKPLLLWVNDLLMAVFFFLVGLEIKREILVGELAGWRRASLPIAGALGGMLVPALIYLAFNFGAPTARGWGVPMATDIAFALGVLALLGDRVSLALKVFLLALAIVDDLGAVLVIAAFYTESVNVGALLLSFLVWGGAFAYGRAGGAKPLAFALIGLVMWYFMLKSGVHATIAGVLMALAVPLRHRLSPQELQQELRPLMAPGGGFEQVEAVMQHLEDVLAKAHSPLHQMEHSLAPYVAFLIMPLFAFFNAGVAARRQRVGADQRGLARCLPRSPDRQADRRRRVCLDRRQERPYAAARRRQLAGHDRHRPARRNRLHDVAVHRQPGVRPDRSAGSGQDRRARGLGGRGADRSGVPRRGRCRARARPPGSASEKEARAA